MSELYAVRDSVDGDFQTGTKEEMEKAYEEAKDTIMDYVSDGSSGDEEVLLLKVVRQAVLVEDEENKDDPKKYGFDYWVKWQDVEPELQPLTLDELRQKCKAGEPIYAESKLAPGESHWCVLDETMAFGGDRTLVAIYGRNLTLAGDDYEKTWIAYESKPAIV